MADRSRTHEQGWSSSVWTLPCCLILLSLGCASHRGYRSVAEARLACEAPGDCSDLTLQSGVMLSASEECWTKVLRQRAATRRIVAF